MRTALVITFGMLLGHAAHADSDDADRLFEQGRGFAKAGQYGEACERFAKSLAIDRTLGTELNLADCHEHLGHLREAWGLFAATAAEAEAANDAKRAAFAHDRARALEASLTTVIVRVAQPAAPGLIITIGGRVAKPSFEIQELADPGEIEVVASVPELPRIVRSERGVAGTTIVIDVPAFVAPVIAPLPVAVDGERDRGQARIAYGLGAIGASSAIAAIALTIAGDLHYDSAANGADCAHVAGGITCNPTGSAAIHDAQHLADLGTGFAILGGALVGSAAIVYFTAPRERIYLRPHATAREAGLVFGGWF